MRKKYGENTGNVFILRRGSNFSQKEKFKEEEGKTKKNENARASNKNKRSDQPKVDQNVVKTSHCDDAEKSSTWTRWFDPLLTFPVPFTICKSVVLP